MSPWTSLSGLRAVAGPAIRELTFPQCETILRRGSLGHLAMRDAGGAYIVPLLYVFADGCLYGHAAPGRKLTLMRRSGHVAFSVEEIEDLARWRSVLVRGKFEELHEDEDRARARMLLVRSFGGNMAMITAGHGNRTTLADAVLFRIVPEEITGRALGSPSV